MWTTLVYTSHYVNTKNKSVCAQSPGFAPTRLMLASPSRSGIPAASARLVPTGAGVDGLPPGRRAVVHSHGRTRGRLSPVGGLLLLWVGVTPSCRKTRPSFNELLLGDFHIKAYLKKKKISNIAKRLRHSNEVVFQTVHQCLIYTSWPRHDQLTFKWRWRIMLRWRRRRPNI